MEWFTEGLPLTLPLEFLSQGQLVEPDAHSIVVTLRGNNGVPLTGADRITVDPPEVTFAGGLTPTGGPDVITITIVDLLAEAQDSPPIGVSIPDEIITGATLLTIPGAMNALVNGGQFEARFLTVEYTVNGVPGKIEIRYRVTPFLPITATPDQVRDLIGVSTTELPDSSIDLYKAYFWLLAINPLTVPAALISPKLANLHLNTAIVLRAALDTFSSLPQRIMFLEKANDASYQRMDLDFDRLKSTITTQLDGEMEMMVNSLNDVIYTPPTIVVIGLVSPIADVITGA